MRSYTGCEVEEEHAMKTAYFTMNWTRVFVIAALSLAIAPAQGQTIAALKTGEVQVAAPAADQPAQSNVQATAQKTPAQPAGGAQNESWITGDHISGNWDGLRKALRDKGIDPFVYWTGIVSGNPVGGAKQGHTTAVDDFYMGVNLDLSKFTDWRGATITISGVNRDGRGLTNNYVQSQYNSQQSVGGQSLFFYQLFLKQQLDEGKISFKVGRFSASDDLNASPIYGDYVNNGIDGDIRNVLFDTQSSAYPFGTWAGLLRFDPNKKFNVQAAIYQTWDNIFNSTTNGVDWTIHSDDGVMLMGQVGWTPTFTKKSDVTSSAAHQLPGHYWIGSTYSPWKGFTQFTSPEKVANSYGFYVHADQMVYQKRPGTAQGLTLWTASAYYPQQNIAIVPFQWNAGAIYQGLFDKRPDDREIFGLIYGRFSRDYAHTIIAQGKGDPKYEFVLEAAHRFQIAKSLNIQPDIQWVKRPAGTGRIPNAVVIGAEMNVVF
jgi:porin